MGVHAERGPTRLLLPLPSGNDLVPVVFGDDLILPNQFERREDEGKGDDDDSNALGHAGRQKMTMPNVTSTANSRIWSEEL
jgi:hypothetical protein